MSSEMRLWRVDDNEALAECKKSRLDLEEQLEDWLTEDIDVLSSDLLVIGRQIDTKLCGVIDLLCLDAGGDCVIVELKRDKTPRTVVAQALDYASWVTALSADAVNDLGDRFLARSGGLAKAFKDRFGEPLPEVLNAAHRILIVGSQLDDASERIIQYLSEDHGVPINFAGFQVFENAESSKMLGRVFLIEPEQIDQRGTTSKRRQNLTYDELDRFAEVNGVDAQYRTLFGFLDSICDGKSTTQSSVSFKAIIGKSTKALFNLIPTDSSADTGLRYQVYSTRFEQRFGVAPDSLLELLPDTAEEWAYAPVYASDVDPDYRGFEGFFKSQEEAGRFIDSLTQILR